MRDPGGQVIGAVATFTDITSLHELQEQREDLLRAVSHDLRNPLTAVLGPDHLRLMRYSSWRGDINLGYSRFIYNPAKGQTLPSLQAEGYTYGGPEPEKARETLYTNEDIARGEVAIFWVYPLV